ncbi:GNAT family N-acetyltransferase [Chloroflexota bacterium]
MINGSKIILRKKNAADAWDDYAWETDPELAQLDAAPTVSISYSQYLLDYTIELRSSRTVSQRFAVDTLDGKHIGNCSYYNLDETRNEVELGIMIGNRDYWDKSYGTDAITTLVNYIFHQLKLKRIHLKTLESNTRAQKCFQKCGFTQYGQVARDGYRFALMEIRSSQWPEEEQQQAES